MDKVSSSSSGIGFTGVLQITFIVLKLCGVIDWSWWWVLAPSIMVAILILFSAVIAALLVWYSEP